MLRHRRFELNPTNTIAWILGLILLAQSSTFVFGNYYATLGLEKSCSDKEIKAAYRKLALQWHPDKNSSPEAAEKFAQINVAHEVLADGKKRSIYDVHGEAGVNQQMRGSGHRSSIFEAFGFGSQRPQQEERTPNLEIPVRLTLNQLYTGVTGLSVSYEAKRRCALFDECAEKCPECVGAGRRAGKRQVAPGFAQQVQVEDSRCSGRGTCFGASPACAKACPRGPLENVRATARVEVPAGARDGDKYVVAERGADEPATISSSSSGGGGAGDVLLVVRLVRNPLFQRDDDDNLMMGMKIPLLDALVGFTTKVTHLDGHEVLIERRGVTSCGSTMRVNGEGMPKKGHVDRAQNGHGTTSVFGDLIVTFAVEFPSHLPRGDEQKDLLRRALG